MASGIPTRRPIRRADENARPTLARAPTTRSKGLPTLASSNIPSATISTTSKSLTKPSAVPSTTGLPVLRRTNTTNTAGAIDDKDALAKKRAALGDVGKGKGKAAGVVGERQVLGGRGADKNGVTVKAPAQAPVVAGTRRTRTVLAEKEKEKVTEKPVTVLGATKRKALAPSRTASRSRSATSTEIPVREKVEVVKEEEPVRKKRKTSSPAFVDSKQLEIEEEDEGEFVEEDDEGRVDVHGRELRLSSGPDEGVGIKSPKLKAARPKDEGWTDLDLEDEGDPTMVAEYVVDAFNYMMEIEHTCMPNPNYMDRQVEIHWKMRAVLMDWLIEVHSKFRLLPETLFIAVNLVDRFLSKRVVSLVKFQLVGLTAMFVAAKYEEVICPSITHFLHMTDGGYGVEEILNAERYLLSTLEFDLSYPNPLHFLRRVSKADGYDIQTRTVAKFLIEISTVEHRLLEYPPSLLAAAGMWLARMCLDRGGGWTPNHVHYSGYSEAELFEPAQIMLDYILNPEFDEQTCFYKKYASKKHMKSSVFVRHWAIDRWPDSAAGEGDERGRELYLELADE